MKRANSSKDRISSLPRDVTESILGRLSIRDAVRTSILSRAWRDKWKTVSKIIFNCKFADENQLETALNRILLLHSSKISTFLLHIRRDLRRVPNVIPLIHHLSTNGIKDLSIFNYVRDSWLVLPRYLFSCQELTHLTIRGCRFRPPPDFSGFHCLLSLDCRNTHFKQVTFESFLPRCPVLEKLSLYACAGLDHLVIDAPNLKDLYINRCNDIKSLCFKNTGDVITAYIQVDSSLNNTDQSQTQISPTMISVFTGFSKIEKLTLGDYGNSYLKLLAAGGVPLCLPNSLSHLKFLKLDLVSLFSTYQVSCVLCLIRSCPNLQELHILGMESVDDDMSSVTNYLEQALTSHASLHHLQEISIDGMKGASPELEIIKFLLASSPTLKTLNVKFESDTAADVMLRASMEMLSFQRASVEAKVILNKTDGLSQLVLS